MTPAELRALPVDASLPWGLTGPLGLGSRSGAEGHTAHSPVCTGWSIIDQSRFPGS